jgi:tRNA threonylcarbamoyladenosine biosynthesis protein TsaE
MGVVVQRSFDLSSEQETAAFAARLAPVLRAGDTILLQGDLGAGKSHFARSLIQARLAALGRVEDVPSPTFTLVQVYDCGSVEIWHCDLYRLGGPDDILELGLDDAFETAICLVEWPDRLGPLAPAGALTLSLAMTGTPGVRTAVLTSDDARWAAILDQANV